MNNDNTEGQAPQMEDYGSPATDADPSLTRSDGSGSNSNLSSTSGNEGMYSGGTEGTSQGSSEGTQFGEFEATGQGTDLTVEMENSDARSGLVKGGEEGADNMAGPGQYGGEAGGLPGNSSSTD